MPTWRSHSMHRIAHIFFLTHNRISARSALECGRLRPLWVPCDGRAKRHCMHSIRLHGLTILPFANDSDAVSHERHKERKAVASDRTPKRCAPTQKNMGDAAKSLSPRKELAKPLSNSAKPLQEPQIQSCVVRDGMLPSRR